MTSYLRFAPSPTGKLHLGNARVALVNWLFARKTGGKFLLRYDDTDKARSTQAFMDGIPIDLKWLGLDWDKEAKQSERSASYDAAAEVLRQKDFLYPCYETAEELDLKRKLARAAGRPPIYDRAALKLGPDERKALEAGGRKPHWRFRLPDATFAWTDMVHGTLQFTKGSASDPILVREDGTYPYMLPSVVDDAEFGITHIIRGDDHIANGAIQIAVMQALGAALPQFAHLPLLADAGGEKLSKRVGSLSLELLRTEGIEPLAIDILLSRLGTSRSPEGNITLNDLIKEFDITAFGLAMPRLDDAQLRRLSAEIIHGLTYQEAKKRLPDLSFTEDFWLAVRSNLHTIDEARLWHRVCYGQIDVQNAGVDIDPNFMRQAAGLLPPEPWGSEAWKAWTTAVASATGAKGKALFRPLRLALTGHEHGPELAALLPLIGRERALVRLSNL